jgi:uncharacterized protein
MRIVLDANVIVAAFAARGLCAEIFRFAIDSCEIVASKKILEEVEKILRKKIKVPEGKVAELISYLEEQFHVVVPKPVGAKECRDKDDLHVLGAALGSDAKFIVTGDKDLLVLKRFKKTKIYNPRQFWNYIQALKS